MKKNILTLAAFIPCLAFAQEARLKYADRMFDEMAYVAAASGYEDVIDRGIDSAQVANKIAMSYDQSGEARKALEWYNYLQRTNKISKDELMRSVMLSREIGDYQGSINRAQLYKQKFGSNDVIDKLIAENTTILQMKESNGNFAVQSQKINTSNSEFGVSYLSDNQVFVTSNKRKSLLVKRVDGQKGGSFYNLYTSQVDNNGQLKKLKRVKGVNTKFNDGPAAFDAKNNLVYFTADNMKKGRKRLERDQNGVSKLKIYRAKLDGNKLKDVEELSFNNTAYSCAHPSLSADGKTLYFSSDKPGGMGGSDIYQVAVNSDGSLGTPMNLGAKVNTSANEYFPYMHPTENLLFFSSDGQPGLGGLDVFVAKMNKTGVAKKIENLGAPINSSGDDFSYISNGTQNKGFLTSDRINGKGVDDIYSFTQQKAIKSAATSNGVVSDEIDNTPIADVLVIVKDKNGMIVDSVRTAADGSYELDLSDIEDDFTIEAQKDDYVLAKKQVDYIPSAEEYKEPIRLMQELDYALAGNVFDKSTQQPIDDVKVTIVDRKTGKTIQNAMTDNGKLNAALPDDYNYGETLDLDVKYEKAGYMTVSKPLTEVLGKNEIIDINKGLTVDLAKVETGKTDLNDIIAINPIYFDYSKWDIRPDAALELDKIVKVMKENPTMVIELGSHTDSRGNDKYNLDLSDHRAKASAAYIVSQGIDASRIKGKGYGETKLKVSNAVVAKAKTAEEKELLHQKNRRTEFIIVKM